MYDVQQVLKKFGIFVYTGNRLGDLELMEAEVRDLYQAKLISAITFQMAILTLKKEKNNL